MKNSIVKFFFVSLITFNLSCENSKEKYPQQANDEKIAKRYCQSCHSFPEPGLLNKETWEKAVLPKMGPFLGIEAWGNELYNKDVNTYNSYLYPSSPIISFDEWASILRYYKSLSPDTLAKSINDNILETLELFQPHYYENKLYSSTSTLVKINPETGEIYQGEAFSRDLKVFNKNRIIKDSLQIVKAPSDIHFIKDGSYILSMGTFMPSDEKAGVLSFYDNKTKVSHIVIDSLPRPIHATYADLNNDHTDDIVICGFGYFTGELAWFENNKNQYIKHVLAPVAGAISTKVLDFNNDGLMDVMALMAQGNEGFDIYLNKGNNIFDPPERVLQLPPSWGSNSFDLIDFNKDGYVDILATNGDNGDYKPILKPYHGIRVYLNNGKNRFEQSFFYPINGCTKAIAIDFDKDGDLDLASISYFPDYENLPQESFVFFENTGNFKFKISTFPGSDMGRWLVMDAADTDADGDIDIVLGSCIMPSYKVDKDYTKRWDKLKIHWVLLENKSVKSPVSP